MAAVFRSMPWNYNRKILCTIIAWSRKRMDLSAAAAAAAAGDLVSETVHFRAHVGRENEQREVSDI